MKEIARQVGQTVREAMTSYKRTVCLGVILISAGTGTGIAAYLGR